MQGGGATDFEKSKVDGVGRLKEASIAFLDRDYYLNESPTLAERAAYSARKQQLEAIRSRFYSELDAIHRGPVDRSPI